MKNYLHLSFLKLWLLLLSFTFHHIFTASSSSSQSQSGRLVTRLIHRDSILFSKKNLTISDRANYAMKTSLDRLINLKAKSDGAFIPYIEGSLIPDAQGTIFLLNVTVGDPEISQLLTFDTGSGLLWIQCSPCKKCPKKPQYNPRKSSTYAPITCHPNECKYRYRGSCDSDGYCQYSQSYKDGSNSTGTVAVEKFTFNSFLKGSAIDYNVIFGCAAKYHAGLPIANGVIGINANPVSFLSSVGSEFSYCIGSINDPHYKHNFLILGDGAILDGELTPIQIRGPGLFYVTLKGITVNQKQLIANPEEFEFRVMVDSGSTISFLARSLYEPLKSEIISMLKKTNPKLRRVVFADRPNLLCYRGKIETDLEEFQVIFHLPGIKTDISLPGVDIELNKETMFLQSDEDVFCMAIDVSDQGGLNIIGAWAQQYSNIGFDLKSKRMSIRSADCEFVAKSF